MKADVVIEDAGSHEDHHSHAHDQHHHHHHRKASDILAMIRSSKLNPNTRRIANAIFSKLAISEAAVHRISPEDVEFHEVGSVDSIVDTVGAAIGFDALGVERFACSAINVGSGFIHCQHGIYPVPAPATADLLRNATIYSKHVNAELVTPTGAAILAAVVTDFAPLDGFKVERIGYGAGTRQFQEFPNCLRLMIGEEAGSDLRPGLPEIKDEIVVIEANIDDMTPQNLAYAADRLLDAGALDVCVIPVQMKKSRPGHLLQVLAPSNLWQVLRRVIFQETTTIGMRYHTAARSTLEREWVSIDTSYGAVKVKVSRLDGQAVNAIPEYDDCARIARDKGIPLKEVQSLVMKEYLESRQAGS